MKYAFLNTLPRVSLNFDINGIQCVARQSTVIPYEIQNRTRRTTVGTNEWRKLMGIYRASKGAAMLPGVPPDGYVDTLEAGRQLRVNLNKIRDLKEKGHIRGIVRKEGLTKRLYIEQASIDAYLERSE